MTQVWCRTGPPRLRHSSTLPPDVAQRKKAKTEMATTSCLVPSNEQCLQETNGPPAKLHIGDAQTTEAALRILLSVQRSERDLPNICGVEIRYPPSGTVTTIWMTALDGCR